MTNRIVANINMLIGKDSELMTRDSVMMENIYLLNDFLIDKIEMKITNCNGEVVYVNGLDWDIEVLDVIDDSDESIE